MSAAGSIQGVQLGTEYSASLRNQAQAGIWLASPAAILLLLLLFLPSTLVLGLSVTSYELGMSSLQFVGLDNYANLVTDPRFRTSIINTCIYFIIVTPVSVLLAIWLAIVIDRQGKLRWLYRVTFFLPITATLVAMATAWEVLLHPTFGLVNNILSNVGFNKLRFLSDPGLALYTLSFIGIWKQLGYNILLITAGISTISPELYEAAAIDGADSGWKKFTLVTWPMLGPVLTFVIVVTCIRVFSEFETVAVLTKGGPAGSTQMMQFTLYEEAFRYFKIGMASAIAVSFLTVVATISLIQTWLAERQVYRV